VTTIKTRGIQALLFFYGVIAIITGGRPVLLGIADGAYGLPVGTLSPVLDNNLRFLAAQWLGVGLLCCWSLPHPAQRRGAILVVAALLLLGGVGRYVSFVRTGVPSPGYLAIALSETLGAAVFYWFARSTAASAD
jgi:hypothetical protein